MIPRAKPVLPPRAHPPQAPPDVAHLARELAAQAQLVWDRVVLAPEWIGLALLGAAALITVLGRHGQRVLNALLLGGAAGAAALWLLPEGSIERGMLAVIGSSLCALFGALALAWGTAFVTAGLLGAAGGLATYLLHLSWVIGAVPAAGFGLLTGFLNHRQLAHWLTGLFSAAFAVTGAAMLLAPHKRGARLPWLGDLGPAAAAFAVLSVALVAINVERDYRARKRRAARTKQLADEELKKKLESQRAAFARAHAIEEARRGE